MSGNTDIDAPVNDNTTITYRMVDIYRHMIDNPNQFQLVECKINNKTTVAIAHIMPIDDGTLCTPLFSWIGPETTIAGMNDEHIYRIEVVDNTN